MPSWCRVTDPAPKPCPVCGKPRCEAARPFCSTRCKDRDLVRWLSGGYAVPGPAAPPSETGDD
ncbi:DNA gyrase inhibitor YacG [Erythrobacteraceae bacterium CFH 75059]|uniref:DNA gyrase inhibitor YacG n=1 Tax=Qipengyuania thermophila TaxID=2509361 RepID=UPI001020010E|nr:DNA gyrase inhibitor YacG [Qipengyuania thermophila]TCD04916.1 DNA gyrase inhibitor YacG [Erythrobacteraceae bacterium CFH 75059]